MPDFNTATRDLIWRGLCLLLFMLCLWQIGTVLQAPPRYRPHTITLTLAPGESQILGQRELAAAQAQMKHIQISRNSAGAWFVQNLSTSKQVLLQTNAGEISLPKPIEGQLGTPVALAIENTPQHVHGMVLGRSHFKLSFSSNAAANQLQIEPNRRVSLFAHSSQVLPPNITWQWKQQPTWQLPLNATSGCLLLAALLLGIAQRRPAWHPFAGAVLAFGGFSALFATPLQALTNTLAPELGTAFTPSLAQAIALASLGPLLWLGMLRPHSAHKTSLGLAMAVNLLAIGLLSQLEMGMLGMDSSWLAYYQKTAALQALGLGGAALLAPWLIAQARQVPKLKTVEIALLFLTLLALGCMVLEVLYGNEGGVFGFQPVELAKPALVALTAHVLALCVGQAFPRRLLVWRLLSPIAVLFALVSLALIHVSDYSPLLLLLLWGGLCALAFTLSNGQKRSACALLLLIACAPLAIFGLRTGWWHIPEQFYGERFSVWLEPALHPHTGYQFLLGAQAILQGGWFGADQAFGLFGTSGTSSTFDFFDLFDGPNSVSASANVMQIPALQDDFALTFFLHRHGLLAAILLWLLQAGLLLALLHRAISVWQASHRLQDFRRVWHTRFYAFVLLGGASFLFGQLLLSWSTNLGILPVMGQPMSFLSAGGSHLFFFLLPLLAFHTLYAPILEETPSCPPMSTTKS